MKKTTSSGALPALLTLLAVGLILLLALPGKQTVPPTASAAEVRTGLEYLRAQAELEPAEVDAVIRLRQAERLDQARKRLAARILAGEVPVWSLYGNYAVLGDARSVGFSLYGYLEEDRIFAGAGDTIRSAEDHLQELQALSPARVYLCYGLNDVKNGTWDSPERYAEEVVSTAKSLEAQIPGARVVVSSILPVQGRSLDQVPGWAEIPRYNQALEQACVENGIHFADNSQAAAEHSDLWEPDGIHLGPDFYPYWACQLAVSGLDDGDPQLPMDWEGGR